MKRLAALAIVIAAPAGKHQVSGGQTRSGAFGAPIYKVSAPNAPRVVTHAKRTGDCFISKKGA